MSTLLKKKSLRAKAVKKYAAKKKQEESAEKTTKLKRKVTFAPDPGSAGADKDKEEAAVKEVAVCFNCVIGFAICIDKGNNAEGGFNKRSWKVCRLSASI